MGNDTRGLPQQTIEELAGRLASLSDLRLPAQLRRQPQGPSINDKRRYISQLLLHDPGVFLERHGSELTTAELAHFQSLRGDYEVDWHLKVLEDQQDRQKQSQVAKNRRLAYMNRLVQEGTYFNEKEMRERQPGIYHQYIGQYRPPEQPQGGETCQAGTILADSIMRQQEELGLRQRQQAEQRQWEEAEEESEEEEEEEDGGNEKKEPAAAALEAASGQQQQAAARTSSWQQDGGTALPVGAGATPAEAAAVGQEVEGDEEGNQGDEEGPSYVRISEEEQQENAAAFLDLMQQRFLAGQDQGVDYGAIDADAELDDDWAEQAGRDAEEKYFDDGD